MRWGNHDHVNHRIHRILNDLNVCSNCIHAGLGAISSCARLTPGGPCSNCSTGGLHRYSLLVTHVFADMASTQVKAHKHRNSFAQSASSALFNPTYGHGYLHMVKSFVASFRKNHLTDDLVNCASLISLHFKCVTIPPAKHS